MVNFSFKDLNFDTDNTDVSDSQAEKIAKDSFEAIEGPREVSFFNVF